ncbi:MAG: hypothetical protein KBF73_10415 [Flavobacteriales bacterium]|nr:hypothetical protein [Flavobacteriales bacterium]
MKGIRMIPPTPNRITTNFKNRPTIPMPSTTGLEVYSTLPSFNPTIAKPSMVDLKFATPVI